MLLSCFGIFGKSSALRPFTENLLLPHLIVSFSPSASRVTSSPERDFTISAIFFAGTAIVPVDSTLPDTFDVTDISRSVAENLIPASSALTSTIDRMGMVVLPGTTDDIAFIFFVSSPSGTWIFTPKPPDISFYYIRGRNHNSIGV